MGVLSRHPLDCSLAPEAAFDGLGRVRVTQSESWGRDGLELEIDAEKVLGRSPTFGNDALLDNPWAREEVAREIRRF